MKQVSRPYAPGQTAVYTTYNYDGLGRTTSVVLPDGSTTSYAYWSSVVAVSDPAGKWKRFVQSAFGDLTIVREPNPAAPTDPNQDHWTYYTYDVLDHLISVSMPRGGTTQTRTFNYNTGNTVGAYLLSATNPENGTVSYTWDSLHRLASKTDGNGRYFAYSYDGLSRLTQVSMYICVPSPTCNVQPDTITYTYDTNPLDSTYSQNAAGRPTVVQYNTAQGPMAEMYSYSAAGLVTGKRLRVTRSICPPGCINQITNSLDFNSAFVYDTLGHLTSLTYPTATPGSFGTTVFGTSTYSYSYDALGRPVGATDPSGTAVISGVSYGPANELLGATSGTTSGTWTYNSLGQLTQMFSRDGHGQTYTTTYSFPAATNNGEVTSMTYADGEQVQYAYDALNRLISATAQTWGQSFSYDGFGNLLKKTVTKGSAPTLSVVVDPATNHIAGLQYDGNGNLLSDSGLGYGHQYGYDLLNRVTGISDMSGNSERYGYDPQNRRVSTGVVQSDGTVVETIHLFGVDGREMSSYSLWWSQVSGSPNNLALVGSGPITTRVYFAGRVISAMFATDRLGSVGKYYPYGEDHNSIPVGGNQVGFATYSRSSFGVDYAMNRWYSSGVGRFTSVDPYASNPRLTLQKTSAPYRATAATVNDSADPESWNHYAYTRGDPANRNDPKGLDDDGCGAFDEQFCEGSVTLSSGADNDPFNLGLPPPGMVNVPCDIFSNGSGVCTISNQALQVLLTQPFVGAGTAAILLEGGATTICFGSGICEIVTVAAAAATIVYGAYLLSKTLPHDKVDCSKVKLQCIDTCSDTSLPTRDHGFRFWNCLNRCMKAAGCQ